MATADHQESTEQKGQGSGHPPDLLARAFLTIALIVLTVALALLAWPVIHTLLFQLARQLDRLWFLIQSFT
jgi:hypothetical protein